ncbi:MAG: zinc ribbon domain-containing protein [Deltaproteobacteria bacterium]|nr:zinc ribbon domain-containing protein [Deltaproteobacteria bacterium]
MPIYEYQCQRCNAHYEVFQKINARPLRKCEKCGGPLTKLISQSSFQLKGTGWYVTDYAGKKASSPSSDSSHDSKPKSNPVSDSKPGSSKSKKSDSSKD